MRLSLPWGSLSFGNLIESATYAPKASVRNQSADSVQESYCLQRLTDSLAHSFTEACWHASVCTSQACARPLLLEAKCIHWLLGCNPLAE